MTRDELAALCNARDTLCGFCEVSECEKCIVTHLIDDAFNECPESEVEYTYLELIAKLYMDVKADMCIPYEDRIKIEETIASLQDLLWNYSA